MNLKEEMIYNTQLEEMAQQHFDDEVVSLMKSGDYEQAANKYIDNHGTAKLAQKATATTGKLKQSNFAKTLKAKTEDVESITNAQWKGFEQAYADLMGSSEESKRKYTKTKGTVDPGTGKIKTSSQSGATRSVSINKLEAKLQKIGAEYQKQLQDAEQKVQLLSKNQETLQPYQDDE